MSLISVDVLEALGITYSLIALLFILPVCFIYRHYLRFFDHLQTMYVLYISIFVSNSSVFSSHLNLIAGQINHNFYIFCSSSDLICTIGFQLSFLSCLAIVLIITFIVTKIISCYVDGASFEPIYRFVKPLIRWTYIALVYWSLYFFLKTLLGQADSLTSSIVVLVICILFPILQLQVYYFYERSFENYNSRIKWLEFFGYLRIFSIAGLCVCSNVYVTQVPHFIIYAPIFFESVVYFRKYNFVLGTKGRVIYVLGELSLLIALTFFAFSPSFLHQYHLQLYFMTFNLFIDAIYYCLLVSYHCKNGIEPLIGPSLQVMNEESESESRIFRRQKIKRADEIIQVEEIGEVSHNEIREDKNTKKQEPEENK